MTERIAGGVYLLDIRERMPVVARPVLRGGAIRRVFVHHSGASGRPGIAGAIASARYSLVTRGWRMPGYHLWIPEAPEDPGRVEVYQCAPWSWRCYHTGGAANTTGLGLALQGNKTRDPLTRNQTEALEALLPWLRDNVLEGGAEDWLSWHSESKQYGGSGKKSCPGANAEAWLKSYRELAGAMK